MNKRTNSDDVIIYKGSHQTVTLTRADFPSDEEFEKWYHWINENTTDRRFGRFITLWKDMDFLNRPMPRSPFFDGKIGVVSGELQNKILRQSNIADFTCTL